MDGERGGGGGRQVGEKGERAIREVIEELEEEEEEGSGADYCGIHKDSIMRDTLCLDIENGYTQRCKLWLMERERLRVIQL